MRITCPNCLAQYEVDAGLLPDEGRDVQCSACDHVWFQPAPPRKGLRTDLAPDGVQAPSPKESAEIPRTLPDVEETEQDKPGLVKARSPEIDARPATAAPRQLDPSISEILKEEARFAQEVAQRERTQVELQPDLGLLSGGPWPTTAQASTAPAPTPQNDMARPTLQTAFPDIDDVSATLEPLGSRHAKGTDGYELPATPKERQRSFLGGFLIPVAIGTVLVILYVLVPLISASAPAAAPAAQAYAGAIDSLRVSLSSLLGMN